MKMNPEQKTVFITGGSRGIGKACADLFLQKGWNVASCSRSSVKKITPNFLSFACNVANAKQVKKTIPIIIKKFGRLDVIINNAGIAGSNSMDARKSDELWHNIINTNLNGTYYVCKEALAHLPNKTGCIINIASVLAFKGVADQSAYTAAKHGVLGFTRALAQLTAPRGITVNAICPGWTKTDMALGRMKELKLSEKNLKQSIPLNDWVLPENVASFAYYLTTQEARMITGQALTIDGGFLS